MNNITKLPDLFHTWLDIEIENAARVRDELVNKGDLTQDENEMLSWLRGILTAFSDVKNGYPQFVKYQQEENSK